MGKGKIISMPASVEAQIRTRARSLPLDRCYVNPEWDKIRYVDIIVTRKHVNGNLTYGYYVVDLFLLGVSDCLYGFNQSPSDVEEQFGLLDDFEECDYILAHNIIFEGISFAEDCGFKPMKDFIKTGKYILEEDTDDFPQMDIPVGLYGVPAICVTPENNMQREIAILEKTVGHGNYIAVYLDEEGNVIDDDDDDDDQGFYPNDYEFEMGEIRTIGVDEYFKKHKEKISPVQQMALTDCIYEDEFFDENVEDYFQLIFDDDRFDSDLERIPELEKYIPELQSVIDNSEVDRDAALSEMQALADKYPDDIYIGISQISLLMDFEMEEELEKKISYWYNRDPNNYAMRLFYAEWLTLNQRYDELFELFGDIKGLDAVTKENVPFTEEMVCNFCACYVLAWLSKDNITKAEPYYQLLLILDSVTKLVGKAFFEMTTQKRKTIVSLMPETQK